MTTKTVKQIVDEYLNRDKNAKNYDSIQILIAGERNIFNDVTNFEEVETGIYEFDYIYTPLFKENAHKGGKKHVRCVGYIQMMTQSIKE